MCLSPTPWSSWTYRLSDGSARNFKRSSFPRKTVSLLYEINDWQQQHALWFVGLLRLSVAMLFDVSYTTGGFFPLILSCILIALIHKHLINSSIVVYLAYVERTIDWSFEHSSKALYSIDTTFVGLIYWNMDVHRWVTLIISFLVFGLWFVFYAT